MGPGAWIPRKRSAARGAACALALAACVDPSVPPEPAPGTHGIGSPLTCGWLRGPSCWSDTVGELCGPEPDDVGVFDPAGDVCFFRRFAGVRIPQGSSGTLVLAGGRGQRACGAVTWRSGRVEVESHRGSVQAERDGPVIRVVCRDGAFEARAEELAACRDELPVLTRSVAAGGTTELRIGARVLLRCDPFPGRDPASIASRKARGEDVPDPAAGTGLGLEGLGPKARRLEPPASP